MLGPLQETLETNEKSLICCSHNGPEAIATISINKKNIEIIALCKNPQSIASSTAKGSGSSIVEYVKTLAAQLGKSSVVVNSLKDAEGFYRKLGFTGPYDNLGFPITPSAKTYRIIVPKLSFPKNKVFIVPKNLYESVCVDLDVYGEIDLASRVDNMRDPRYFSQTIILGIWDKDENFTGICLLDLSNSRKLIIKEIVDMTERKIATSALRAFCSI